MEREKRIDWYFFDKPSAWCVLAFKANEIDWAKRRASSCWLTPRSYEYCFILSEEKAPVHYLFLTPLICSLLGLLLASLLISNPEGTEVFLIGCHGSCNSHHLKNSLISSWVCTDCSQSLSTVGTLLPVYNMQNLVMWLFYA